MELWLPVLLFAVGFVALFIELLVPALGTIGGSGIICMIVSTVLAYRNFGNSVGTIFLMGTLVGTPALVLIGLKMFPRTLVGKKLILGEIPDPKGQSALTKSISERTSSRGEPFQELIGRRGTALTTLRPSGMVMIDDRKYSVVTGGELIEKAGTVKVVKVEGNRIVVREIKPSDEGGSGDTVSPKES
jgi:membrane-bound serine protease (ClpP class)